VTVEATNPETEVEEEEVDQVAEPEVDSEVEGEDSEEEAVTEPETEEVEHDGKKYKIDKALKPALMMHADYTRKTQELATQRRQVEEQFQAREKQTGEFLADVGKVQALKNALTDFEKVQWADIRSKDPALCDQLWFQYQQTKDQAGKAETELNAKMQARATEAQRESVKQLQDGAAQLQRDIPGWGPELAGKLNSFAIDHGFTPEELRQVTDPRVIKLLHAAYQGTQTKKQTETKQAATKTAAVAEAAKPLPTVTARSAAAEKIRASDPASDKLSTEEWARRRNEQLRKRAGR
jgi:hypothetical protein